jgi:hypothetical protein
LLPILKRNASYIDILNVRQIKYQEKISDMYQLLRDMCDITDLKNTISMPENESTSLTLGNRISDGRYISKRGVTDFTMVAIFPSEG